MTSDVDWDPSLYDNVIDDIDDFHDPTLDFIDHDNPFNEIWGVSKPYRRHA
jgi:hypothetical protein